jgi:hypothetical protein
MKTSELELRTIRHKKLRIGASHELWIVKSSELELHMRFAMDHEEVRIEASNGLPNGL